LIFLFFARSEFNDQKSRLVLFALYKNESRLLDWSGNERGNCRDTHLSLALVGQTNTEQLPQIKTGPLTELQSAYNRTKIRAAAAAAFIGRFSTDHYAHFISSDTQTLALWPTNINACPRFIASTIFVLEMWPNFQTYRSGTN
jgi:hypothetical protein